MGRLDIVAQALVEGLEYRTGTVLRLRDVGLKGLLNELGKANGDEHDGRHKNDKMMGSNVRVASNRRH